MKRTSDDENWVDHGAALDSHVRRSTVRGFNKLPDAVPNAVMLLRAANSPKICGHSKLFFTKT
jgi:hypothetical protein